MRKLMFPVLGLLAIVLFAACGGDDASSDAITATSAAPTTTQASTTNSTSAPELSPVELVATFDGEVCTYEGPEAAALDDELSLTLVNNSADQVRLRLAWVPPERKDLLSLVGSDFDSSSEEFLRYSSEGVVPSSLAVNASPSSEASAASFLASPGNYLVQCATIEGGAALHVWLLAAIGVSP